MSAATLPGAVSSGGTYASNASSGVAERAERARLGGGSASSRQLRAFVESRHADRRRKRFGGEDFERAARGRAPCEGGGVARGRRATSARAQRVVAEQAVERVREARRVVDEEAGRPSTIASRWPGDAGRDRGRAARRRLR